MTELTLIKDRQSRAKTLRSGKVRVDGIERRALIRNLSPSGANIQADLEVAAGDTVSLYFGEYQPVRATVRWQRRNRFGVEFDDEIDILSSGAPDEIGEAG